MQLVSDKIEILIFCGYMIMTVTIKILWGILVLGLLCGVGALATWGIPAPSAPVVKVIPNQKFLNPQQNS